MSPDPTTIDPAIAGCVREVVAAGGRIVALTGAGISAESGVPTFRGPEGYWTVGSRHYQPMELATRAAFSELPWEVWHWYLWRRTVCRRARPNEGHEALVRLERALGERFRLVTQNVDGIHLRAGHDPARLYQIHGNIDFMRCAAECHPEVHPVPDAIGPREKDMPLREAERELLVCPRCSGRSRPHVLWFDECYDEAHFFFETSLRAAADADLLLIVGTSGATNLPLQVAGVAMRRGIPIIDVNKEDNVFADAAARSAREGGGGGSLRGSAGAVLPALLRAADLEG